MRHGISAAWVGFALIAAVIVFAVKNALVWNAVASLSASEVVQRYTLAIEDKEIQLLKSGFEKTAVLYSLMDTAKELGAHGGLSKKALEKNDTLWYVKGASPTLRFETMGGGRIPYWVAPSAETSECGTTKERVPYLRVTDRRVDIGTIPVAGKAEEAYTDAVLVWNSANEYTPYFQEVHNGKYALYVLLQVFFIKPGDITVECGVGCKAITDLNNPPGKIISDGIYEYKVTDVDPAAKMLDIKLIAKDGAGLDGKNVARLKQAVVSIYDKTIDNGDVEHRMASAGNEVFTENLNKFQANANTALESASTGKTSKIQVGKLEGAFYRAIEPTYPAGIVWSPEGIVSETQDYLGNDKLLTLRSSGVTEEEAKIRYWLMYDYAEKFARCADGILKYRLFKAVNTLQDYATTSRDACATPYSCGVCASDTTPTLKRDDFYNKISSELQELSKEYTSQSPPGISWSISLPSDFFKSTCNINEKKSPCESDSCTNAGENIETYKYMRGRYYNSGCCNSCAGCLNERNTCSMQYGHRYILKNIRILVTITDTGNKIYDPADKWAPLKFSFFVDIPIVDDNDCGGLKCDSLAENYAGDYPAASPSLQSQKGCSIGASSGAPPAGSSAISISFASPAPGTEYTQGDSVPFKVSITTDPSQCQGMHSGAKSVEYYFKSPYDTPAHTETSGDFSWTWVSNGGANNELVGSVPVTAVAKDYCSNFAMAYTTINLNPKIDAPVPVPTPTFYLNMLQEDSIFGVILGKKITFTAKSLSENNNVRLNIALPKGVESQLGSDLQWSGTLNTGEEKSLVAYVTSGTSGSYTISGEAYDAGGVLLNKAEITVNL